MLQQEIIYRDMDRKQLQRLVILIFGLAFIGSTGFAIVGSLFNRNNTTTDPATNTVAPSVAEQLEAQARGYAKVLEREPENETALSGLVQTSLQTGDLEAAIPPLQKLIELYPEDTQLTNLLTEIEAQLAQQSPSKPTEATPDLPE